VIDFTIFACFLKVYKFQHEDPLFLFNIKILNLFYSFSLFLFVRNFRQSRAKFGPLIYLT